MTVQLDTATPKAVFTSLNPPAAVMFTYSDYEADGVTVRVSQQFVSGPKTSQIEVRIDKDKQDLPTEPFWHHVFVTNKTAPFAKVQVNVDVYMIAARAEPEKGGAMEGKDTSNEKSATESAKAAKEAKENKDAPDKTSKENTEKTDKEHKDSKESKENTEKTDKEHKDSKESKENTEKTDKEHKDSKESKEGKEGKENKESKENKDSKEQTKESKEKEATKEHKEHKESKEAKEDEDKTHEKGHLGAKEIDTPAPAPGLPAILLAAPLFDPDPSPALPVDQHAFIRSEERPPVGDNLARRGRLAPPPP